MNTIQPHRNGSPEHANTGRRLPWHWLLLAAALLAAAWGGWMLWGPMPIARPLPPGAGERFWLKDVAGAGDLKPLQHRQVNLLGRFTGHTVVVEGEMAGRSGFYVLAPLAERRSSYADGSETGLAVLVQRGWTPTRESAQVLIPPKHDVSIQGRLAIPALGTESKAAVESGLFRKNLSLPRYASEIGVPLVPMVVLEQPNSDTSERDIRQDAFQRRWPQLYPQDKSRARKGWAMLVLAAALAALGLWARPRRRHDKAPAFAETVPDPAADAGHPAGAVFPLWRHAKVLAVLGIAAVAAASMVVRYQNEFSRLQQVEVGSTPLQPGSLGQLVFRNDSASRIAMLLHCHDKVRAGGKPLFSGAVVLPPNASVQFDVNPEYAGRVPPIIREKSCEAVWRGPFGIERSAWWVTWRPMQSAHKTTFLD
ncbi:SURF1 family cytochrome oxidase biogenesis protein [Caenimonas terrae]|uniref:SURF1-like protein n=1 Tax=Caenimonas terrae TaxID=696074 RepID=A0ABW0NIC6_9BURK